MGAVIKIAGTLPAGAYPKIGLFLALPAGQLLEGWRNKPSSVTRDATTAAVSAWAGQNGGSATQTTVANQPVYGSTAINNMPGITFPGGSSMLNTSLSLPGTGYMVVGIQNNSPTAGAVTQGLIGSEDSSTSRIWLARKATASGDQFGVVIGNVSISNGGLSPTVLPFGGRHVVGVYWTPTTFSLRVDGVQVAGGAQSGPVPTSNPSIGSHTAPSSNPFLGAECVMGVAAFYTGALTASQLAQIDSVIAGRIGN
ncbi:hypothetical protein [Burkholderia sp. IDO3]|uniref:hypothetical protein n=1 Tax=Burkholderia sp. IDO3 TaxID=1705310 RepID=UPI001177FC9E|nr:hypothetical protein [Burkholderia sp. IDO3]